MCDEIFMGSENSDPFCLNLIKKYKSYKTNFSLPYSLMWVVFFLWNGDKNVKLTY